MTHLWKKSLLSQVVGSFSILSFAIIGLAGGAAFLRARMSLKQSVFERLETVASLKESEIEHWLTDRQNTLISLKHVSDVKASMIALLTTSPSSTEYEESVATLQSFFSNFAQENSDYREIYILSRGSRVVMSTQPEHIGHYRPRDQSSETVQDSSNTTFFISNFYQSPETLRPTVTLSAPILDNKGNRLGTISAHVNLDRIDQIIGKIHDGNKTYLITDAGNSFAEKYVFASAQRFEANDFPEGLNSPGIMEAMHGGRGRGLYHNHQGIPVVGTYRWLEAQNVALLVEMDQAEAFKLANQLARSIVVVGLLLAAVITVVIWLLGRQMINPILKISQTARLSAIRVQAGQVSALETVEVASQNEIGTLAAAFNQMTQHVSESYEKLEDQNQALESALGELKKTQLQMIQSEKMAGLGQMVAGIAHEVNNPVNFIHGNLIYVREYVNDLLSLVQLYSTEYPEETPAIADKRESIDLDFLKQDFVKVLGSMTSGTQRIQAIVKSMRSFSRLDESDHKIADIHDGLEGSLLIIQHRLKRHSHRPAVKVIKHYGHLTPIACSPGQLNQVFLNLMSNAIDAMDDAVAAGHIEQPILEIDTVLAEDTVTVRITDNGIGIDKETCEKIFDPFFTTKPVGKGTGLGLSVSYAIVVDHHQGKLTCHSTPTQGSTFTVSIPAKKFS